MGKKLVFTFLCFLVAPVLALGQDCLPNGDMNCDSVLSLGDVVGVLIRVYENTPPACDTTRGDLNCEGFWDAADVVLIVNCFFFGYAPLGPCPVPFARPFIAHPSDSIIIESKTVAPGIGQPADSLMIWITNKDSLSNATLLLRQLSISGNAFLMKHYVVQVRQDTTLYAAGRLANDVSPDSFYHSGSGFRPGRVERPNAVRQSLWALTFDTVKLGFGECEGVVELDSFPLFYDLTNQFVDKDGRRVPVNFTKSVVRVVAKKGDMNNDGEFRPADVVLLLNCVFQGTGSCEHCYADVNCDGILSPADVVIELQMVFLGAEAGC